MSTLKEPSEGHYSPPPVDKMKEWMQLSPADEEIIQEKIQMILSKMSPEEKEELGDDLESIVFIRAAISDSVNARHSA